MFDGAPRRPRRSGTGQERRIIFFGQLQRRFPPEQTLPPLSLQHQQPALRFAPIEAAEIIAG